MICLLRIFSWLIPLCLLQASVLLTPAHPGALARLRLNKLKAYPGDVLRADLKASSAIERLDIFLAGHRIMFRSTVGLERWSGLVGIDLETKPGEHTLKGTVTLAGGQTVGVEQDFRILPKTFPVQRIRVDEKFVTLDREAERRVAEETKKLQAIWKSSSPERLWRGRFILPVASDMTTGFGRRRIVNNQARSPHAGVDLKAGSGRPIRASNGGRVVLAEDLFFSGKTVAVDHGLGLYTYYAHCSRMLVQPGEIVKRGQAIAEVGATGRATGPHLHWACRLNEARVNPLELTKAWMSEEPGAVERRGDSSGRISESFLPLTGDP